jgi:hypothetical protein
MKLSTKAAFVLATATVSGGRSPTAGRIHSGATDLSRVYPAMS